MLEGMADMMARYELWYIARCELRHSLASLSLVGAPLLAFYLTSTMLSGGPGTCTFPSWWRLGAYALAGLALGCTLHCAIDFDWLPWLFPSGWA